ncbi:MAG: hemolysin family protein [Thermomicrobiales bacterium]|jgi:CBS domain containing-hemolysin-like protein|nr:hemolysin family protein [Thermomicrobiales bacterium]
MNEIAKTTIERLVAVLVIVLLNGFFVAAEFALVSVRRTRIAQLVSEGSGRAKRVQRAITHLDVYIAATQLGVTIASLLAGAVGETMLTPLLEPWLGQVLPREGGFITAHLVAVIISFAFVTVIAIVLGELVPKNLALQRTEPMALWIALPLDIFLRIFRPVVLLLRWLGNLVLRLLGLQPGLEHSSVHSVEELELLVHSSREAGYLEEQQERMVAGVFDFGERQASRVMTPRTELDAVPVTTGLPELTARAADGPHSRLAVYEGDLDHIIGVVHAKDVLRTLERAIDTPTNPAPEAMAAHPFDLRAIVRDVPFVPESLPLDELMAELRKRKAQVAVVVDEFGGTAGIVTLEDLLEEIVGEVADEFDSAQESITPQPDGSVLLDGLVAIEEADERFGLGIEEPFYETVGGYVFGQLGRAAVVGDEVATPSGRQLRVTELDGLRVARVLLLPPGENQAGQDGAPAAAGLDGTRD